MAHDLSQEIFRALTFADGEKDFRTLCCFYWSHADRLLILWSDEQKENWVLLLKVEILFVIPRKNHLKYISRE